MTRDAGASPELAQKFAREKDSDTPYRRWLRSEGLDVISAHYVRSLHHVDLKPWPRRGGRGVFINHDASRTTNDCYVCEIGPGGTLAPQRQLYEEMIYILDGHGSTMVWNSSGKRVSFEWKAGAIFGIPLNTMHQHFNGSGQAPARFVAVTNAPPVINLYEDLSFVFGRDYDFTTRFSGEPDYFSGKGEQNGLRFETNFIPNVLQAPVASASERGAGGGMIRFNLSKSSIGGHISQFPVGTYKKAHAHGPGAHVIILSGEGYSLMWEDGEEPRRYDWEVGTLIVPPNGSLHQHFNTGPFPSRYLAFKHGSQRNSQGVLMCWISRRLGGDQIDYADESPVVREMFAEALRRHNLEPQMESAYRKELETLPPLPQPG